MAKQGRTALITGASSGFGLEFARLFAADGYDLVLVARSTEKMQALAQELTTKHGVKITVITKDLTLPTAPAEIFAETESKGIQVDILINNAGYASYGLFTEIDTAKDMDMIQLNVAALTYFCKLYLPGMKARKYGKIMNVASTAAFFPGPLMAVYYASKAFVLTLSESIALEYRGTGVTINAFCPGKTETGFQERAAMQGARIIQSGLMDAAVATRMGYQALMKDKVVSIPGLVNKLSVFLPRLLPRGLMARFIMYMQARVAH